MAAMGRTVLPSYVLLDRIVRSEEEAVEEESEWAAMECADWKSYGCHPGDKRYPRNAARVKGMLLLARLAEPPGLSELSIRLSAAAAVPRPPPASFPPGAAVPPIPNLPDASPYDDPPLTYVEAAGDGLIALTSCFRDGCSCYLVYDVVGKSLSMIPGLPESCLTYCSMRPLPLRTAAAGGYALRSSYSLAIVAKDRRFDMEAGGDVYRDVLCLCPPRPSSSSSSRGGITPWQFKDAIFPSQMPGSFHGDKVFSFGGHAFWADLAKGVLFCRCDDALSGRNDDAVQFRYIPLPVECHLKISFAMRGDLQLCRTMSCVDGGGDSIKFVCISDGGSSSAHTGDRAITMWTLTLATGEWLKDAQLMVADLWELEGFDKARLPKAIPISPVLNPQEDGVLSFMLNDADAELYMVSLNMHSKKLLSSLTLSSCPDDIVPPLGLDLSKDLQNLSLRPIAAESVPAKTQGRPIATKRRRSSLP
ncbi:hypothetical protein OsI_11599 [Oryza sativa Indica Group]|jgi:hypothetical protein|uniref:DUF1618 domain-containing protein n=2 Tax=Oryza TaxID=4527 RepID=A0A0E0GMI2_ORYNI|nr:hypothetical protein OsI_11599 [Oryza sativa Indica Group]